MEITIFTGQYRQADSIANFMDFYYGLRMQHLASDLFDKGFTTTQVNDALTRAINVSKSSGLHIQQHFRPVFSAMEKEIVSDCKLSHLGYGLVLMNADSNLSLVGDFQLDVLKRYLGTHS